MADQSLRWNSIDDEPYIRSDGCKVWRHNGKRHRINGPAVIYEHGDQEWWVNGERHREDGPAIIRSNGNMLWYINGKLHREDGPALMYKEYQCWYINGKLHRIDGPAVNFTNGYKEWWINDENVTDFVTKWMKLTRYKWNKNNPWKKERIAEFLLMINSR